MLGKDREKETLSSFFRSSRVLLVRKLSELFVMKEPEEETVVIKTGSRLLEKDYQSQI